MKINLQSTREVAPCKECTERYTACHDKCEKYKLWKESLEKVKEERLKYAQCHFNSNKHDFYKH